MTLYTYLFVKEDIITINSKWSCLTGRFENKHCKSVHLNPNYV